MSLLRRQRRCAKLRFIAKCFSSKCNIYIIRIINKLSIIRVYDQCQPVFVEYVSNDNSDTNSTFTAITTTITTVITTGSIL